MASKEAKDRAAEEAAKQFKKQLEDARQAELEYNTREYARLNKVRQLLVQHWQKVAGYVADSERKEKARLSEESQRFNEFIRRISEDYSVESINFEQQERWNEYLQEEICREAPLLASLDVLLNAVQPDSTVESLQALLSENDSIRPFIEQRTSLYEVFLAVVAEITQQMQRLQKISEICMPVERHKSKLLRRNNAFLLQSASYGDVLEVTDLRMNQTPTELFSIFNARPDFKNSENCEKIIDLTLNNELFKPNPTPKIQEFDAKMNLIENVVQNSKPAKKTDAKELTVKDNAEEQPAPEKKKKKKEINVPPQQAADCEIELLADIFASRSEHFKQYINEEFSEFDNALQKAELLTVYDYEAEMEKDEAARAEDSKERAEACQEIKGLLQAAIRDSEELEFITKEELEEVQSAAILQSKRVLLRAYLFDFMDLAAKAVVENYDEYGDSNETIKLAYPPFAKDQDVESSKSDGEERSEGSQNEELNYENLEKLNENEEQEKKEENLEELMEFETEGPKTHREEEEEVDKKYCSFRNPRAVYNPNNITSINEELAIVNRERIFPSIRDGLQLQYVVLKHNGEFLGKNSEQISKLLSEIVLGSKYYFLGTRAANCVYFEPFEYKIPYLSIEERNLLKLDQAAAKPNEKQEIDLLNEKLEQLSEVNNFEFEKQLFVEGFIITASQGKGKTVKHTFTPGFKVTIPGVLTMSNLAVRVSNFAANLTGNTNNESFDCIALENLPENLDLKQFYPYSEIECSGDIENIFNLINEIGVEQYIKENVEVKQEEVFNGTPDLIEKLNSLMHPNIQRLFEQRTLMKTKISEFKEEIILIVKDLECTSIYGLKDTEFINDLIITMCGIEFLQNEIQQLDFIIVKQHYELMQLAQNKEVLATKGKKSKKEVLESEIRENNEILKEYIEMFGKKRDSYTNWFAAQLESLIESQTMLKTKGKNKFEIETFAEMKDEVDGLLADEEENDYKTPQIVPISDCYHVDVIRVPQVEEDINNWTPKVLLEMSPQIAERGHNSYEFTDEEYDELNTMEENPSIEISRPIRDQIKAIRDALRAKRGNIKIEKISIDVNTINSVSVEQATTLIEQQEEKKLTLFKQICLTPSIEKIINTQSHISDYYSRESAPFDKCYEYLEDNNDNSEQKVLKITKELYEELTPYIDSFIFPSSSTESYNTYPGFNEFKIAELAKKRAQFNVMDSTLFWNYAVNDNNDINSVVNPNSESDDKETQTIEIDIQLSDELRAGIIDILQPEEAVEYLQQAFLFEDYSQLLGSYFVGFWNSGTQTYDPEGILSVNYEENNGILSLKVLKTGIFAICIVKEAFSPLRGWAAESDISRGDGYSIQDATTEYYRFVGDCERNEQEPNTSVTMSHTPGQSTIGDIKLASAKLTRFSYYMPFNILQRTGKLNDVPDEFTASDVVVPPYLERALKLCHEQSVCVHSVILKLLLTSRIMLEIRVLPEGYEIISIKDAVKVDVLTERPLDYANYDEFYAVLENEEKSLPNSLKSLVFTSIKNLFAALKKCGILLIPLADEEIKQLGFTPKNTEAEIELARQLAIVLCSSEFAGNSLNESVGSASFNYNGMLSTAAQSEQVTKPLVSLVTSSPWNRKLPKKVTSYPQNNEFQELQNQFDMAAWMVRGRVPPEEIENYRAAELKRLRKEKRDMKAWMKEERSTDEKAARKAVTTKVEEKVEKGAPPPLGPAYYGMKSEAVDKREKAISDTENWIKEYLSAVDLIREVSADDSSCFVVYSDKIVQEKDELLPPLDYHIEEYKSLALPPKKDERPELPKTAVEMKKHAKQQRKLQKEKERQAKENIVEEQEEEPRCTQTRPFVENLKDCYTIAINKTAFDGCTVRTSEVPLNGPLTDKEEFCSVCTRGTVAHSGILGLFGIKEEDSHIDCVLVQKVFEILCYLRVASLG